MNETDAGRAAIDRLRSANLADARECTRARLRMLQRYAEIDQLGGAALLRLRGLVDLVQIDLGCTRRFAKEFIRDLDRFVGRSSLTAEALEPTFAVTARALAQARLSFEHARVIAEAVETLPAAVRAEHGRAVEARLVQHASELDPIGLKKLADRIIALLDEDGPEPKDEVQYRRRSLQVTTLADGSSMINGRLTATATAMMNVILTSLASARSLTVDEDGNPVDGPDTLGPDPRTAPQRQHDALEEACRLLLQTGRLPDHAGLKADLIITIDLRDLEARTGQASTHHGGTLTVQQVLHLAAETNVIPVILDQELGLESHGRGKRLATPIQRKAVFARDRGCTFPGCDRTAAQSEVHHMQEWLDHGLTNLDNLTLTCGYHNNEAPRQGWKARLINGVPHWTPPAWRDPQRRARRNYLHHPELIAPPTARPAPSG